MKPSIFKLIPKRLPPVIMLLFFVDIALCIAYLLNYWAGQPGRKTTSLLDLDGESSLANWYSSTKYFCIFVLSLIFFCNKYRENKRSFLLIFLPVLFLLMSIDESVQIHEWLGKKSDILLAGGTRAGTVVPKTGIWMLVFGLPFLLVFLWLIYWTKDHFAGHRSTLKKLIVGMIIMLAGALGFETLSNFVGNASLVAEIVFEEGLEMIGATVMFWAMYDGATGYAPNLGHHFRCW